MTWTSTASARRLERSSRSRRWRGASRWTRSSACSIPTETCSSPTTTPARGLLSRLLVQIPVSGTYAVGVTTFGDPTFTGTGGSDSGRYVLNISSYTGTLIAPGDDGSVEVPLGFSFPFQGTNWSSVFVNGNGNLTFGEGNDDFTESVAELLSGPPRIAPLWDDLFSPLGLVIAEPGHKSMTIHFVSVPEFLTQGTNYFSVRLDDKGGVTLDYMPTNRSDALVGLSQGGGAADPGPTDLLRPGRSPPSARRTRRSLRFLRELERRRFVLPLGGVQKEEERPRPLSSGEGAAGGRPSRRHCAPRKTRNGDRVTPPAGQRADRLASPAVRE